MNRPDENKNAAEVRAPAARHRVVAISLICLVIGMVGLSYAAVPLYRLFCQVTGYGGTTQKAQKASDVVLDKVIQVRFDANVAPGVPWLFKPVKRTVEVKIGENVLVFYKAKNFVNKRRRGTATFNVTPEAAGAYFNKIDCFCFTDQVLEGGQEVDMPLTFFVDPEIVNDPEARNIREITLSYTFFPLAGKPRDADKQAKDKSSKLQHRDGMTQWSLDIGKKLSGHRRADGPMGIKG